MRVLIACEFSGIVREAFRAKGHDAVSCDLLDTEIPGPHYKGSIYRILDDNWDLMIAFPPCTYLTVTGNKWFKPKYKDRFPDRQKRKEEALLFVDDLFNCDIPFIALENPVGAISTFLRKPDQIIQPYQFGHIDRKRTCLWLKNLPHLKPTKIVEPNIKFNKNGKSASVHHDKLLALPHAERGKARSITYQGIADAMADQWG